MNQSTIGQAVITHEQIYQMLKSGETDVFAKCIMLVRDAVIDEALVQCRGQILPASRMLGIQHNTLRTYVRAKGKPLKTRLKPHEK